MWVNGFLVLLSLVLSLFAGDAVCVWATCYLGGWLNLLFVVGDDGIVASDLFVLITLRSAEMGLLY